ncbi:hypothetical protein HUT06_18835 [Actinomadura sp. NAK00032]|uniref:hypothetical protein n=1 Tax=Actinomadura sp. NAK00032 TaxID=2742128 RepID=UPI00158FAC0D|nr:hypothetical protein [Actinomadura sp. NAK00032]QKW35838.1 hypothetical protein HUT06_18835 [Actinomadura sp. NAK00032]
MKSRRPARRGRRNRLWGRIAGYGGTLALVAAAVVVLLQPLMDDGEQGTAGAQGPASPSASPVPGQAGVPGAPGTSAMPTNPVPQQNGSGRPYPSAGAGGQGGGPTIPEQNTGDSLDWCPDGTGLYRVTSAGVNVLVTVSASGLIRAEVVLKGRAPKSQQATASAGRPHTFYFAGVSGRLIERVKVTTVSVGGGMQSCYARGV